MGMTKKMLEEVIIEVIKTCYDPEIPVDIYSMGLIYGIKIDDTFNVDVEMTLTSPNCPVAESLPAEVEAKIQGIKDVNKAKIEIVFEPPWQMDMMSEDARLELGML
jgi:FeS assembly SUF system protein